MNYSGDLLQSIATCMSEAVVHGYTGVLYLYHPSSTQVIVQWTGQGISRKDKVNAEQYLLDLAMGVGGTTGLHSSCDSRLRQKNESAVAAQSADQTVTTSSLNQAVTAPSSSAGVLVADVKFPTRTARKSDVEDIRQRSRGIPELDFDNDIFDRTAAESHPANPATSTAHNVVWLSDINMDSVPVPQNTPAESLIPPEDFIEMTKGDLKLFNQVFGGVDIQIQMKKETDQTALLPPPASLSNIKSEVREHTNVKRPRRKTVCVNRGQRSKAPSLAEVQNFINSLDLQPERFLEYKIGRQELERLRAIPYNERMEDISRRRLQTFYSEKVHRLWIATFGQPHVSSDVMEHTARQLIHYFPSLQDKNPNSVTLHSRLFVRYPKSGWLYDCFKNLNRRLPIEQRLRKPRRKVPLSGVPLSGVPLSESTLATATEAAPLAALVTSPAPLLVRTDYSVDSIENHGHISESAHIGDIRESAHIGEIRESVISETASIEVDD